MKKLLTSFALVLMSFTANAQTYHFDVNGNGTIDITDALLVIDYILGRFTPEDDNPPQSYLTCPDKHHPHMIDLGLPSGTKWLCCNEGASMPEEYGEYYDFRQVSTAPSFDQIEELHKYCTPVWTTFKGVNGRQFTGSNGGVIFLPAAGYLSMYGELHDVGTDGNYWSSIQYSERGAYGLHFDSGGATKRPYSINGRYGDDKLSVRSVR